MCAFVWFVNTLIFLVNFSKIQNLSIFWGLFKVLIKALNFVKKPKRFGDDLYFYIHVCLFLLTKK